MTEKIDRKGNENGELKKKRKRQKIGMSRVQKLYRTCKQVFTNCKPGVVPSPENVELVKSVLGMFFFSLSLYINLYFFSLLWRDYLFNFYYF